MNNKAIAAKRFPIWKVETALGAIYSIKARTGKEFAHKVQRLWRGLPWEENAHVYRPTYSGYYQTLSLGYWMRE